MILGINPFNEKDAFDDKLSILDIKVRDQRGRQYEIEFGVLALLSWGVGKWKTHGNG